MNEREPREIKRLDIAVFGPTPMINLMLDPTQVLKARIISRIPIVLVDCLSHSISEFLPFELVLLFKFWDFL